MAPRSSKVAKKGRPVGKKGLREEDKDDVDMFIENKYGADEEFDANDADSDGSEDEEAVMDIDGSDDDDDDDDDDNLLHAMSDDENFEQKVPDESKKLWGRKKDAFYSADNVDIELTDDSDDARLEEEEAKRMQKERSMALRPEDFGEETFGSKLTKKSKSAAKKSAEEGSKANKFQTSGDVEVISKDISKLSKSEKTELLLREAPELLAMLDQFKESATAMRDHILPLIEKVKSSKLPTDQGLSYLEVKLHLILSYCTNIAFYFLLKAEGRSVKDHPVIEKLVETRALLEKMRPLDAKLRYQVEKLLKATSAASKDHEDPLRYKSNIAAGLDNEGSEDGGSDFGDDFDAGRAGGGRGGRGHVDFDIDDDDAGESGVYRAPHIHPMHFEDAAESRRAKKLTKKTAKVKDSEMVKALREEFGDAPEEYANIGSQKDNEIDDFIKAREKHEEDRFIRLTLSKKDKAKLKLAQGGRKISAFEDFDDFNDIDFVARGDAKSGDLPDIFRKRSLADIANENRKRARKQSGDEDLPERNRDKIVQSVQQAKQKRESVLADINDDGDFDDMDLFGNKTGGSKKKKVQKKKKPQPKHQYAPEPEAKDRRDASQEMMANRGLTPYRSKDKKNPRKKHRLAFEKKSIKLRTSSYGKQKRDGPYGGETTGIRANISRSVPMG